MLLNGKDSFWLQLEVCREYQRSRCTRSDGECKFAHPPPRVEIQSNGRVIACYDSIKGRCARESCKYMHPPTHLRDQLLINGRNHLALKNAMLQQQQQTQLSFPATAPPPPPPPTSAAAATAAAAAMASAAAAAAAGLYLGNTNGNGNGNSPHHQHQYHNPQNNNHAISVSQQKQHSLVGQLPSASQVHQQLFAAAIQQHKQQLAATAAAAAAAAVAASASSSSSTSSSSSAPNVPNQQQLQQQQHHQRHSNNINQTISPTSRQTLYSQQSMTHPHSATSLAAAAFHAAASSQLNPFLVPGAFSAAAAAEAAAICVPPFTSHQQVALFPTLARASATNTLAAQTLTTMAPQMRSIYASASSQSVEDATAAWLAALSCPSSSSSNTGSNITSNLNQANLDKHLASSESSASSCPSSSSPSSSSSSSLSSTTKATTTESNCLQQRQSHEVQAAQATTIDAPTANGNSNSASSATFSQNSQQDQFAAFYAAFTAAAAAAAATANSQPQPQQQSVIEQHQNATIMQTPVSVSLANYQQAFMQTLAIAAGNGNVRYSPFSASINNKLAFANQLQQPTTNLNNDNALLLPPLPPPLPLQRCTQEASSCDKINHSHQNNHSQIDENLQSSTVCKRIKLSSQIEEVDDREYKDKSSLLVANGDKLEVDRGQKFDCDNLNGESKIKTNETQAELMLNGKTNGHNSMLQNLTNGNEEKMSSCNEHDERDVKNSGKRNNDEDQVRDNNVVNHSSGSSLTKSTTTTTSKIQADEHINTLASEPKQQAQKAST